MHADYELYKPVHTHCTICFNSDFRPRCSKSVTIISPPYLPGRSITQISFEQRTNGHITERK